MKLPSRIFTVAGSAGLTALWLVLTLGGIELSPAAQNAARPNVVLVMTDDQGYGDLACHGNTMIRTPLLDRLYAQSARLTDFHVDPTCSPTRAALLTGRYSTRGGVWHTIMGRSILYRDEVTLAQHLAHAGYATAIFGKWHLGDNFPYRPQDRGFQTSCVLGGGGITQTPDHWGNTYFDDTYLKNGTPKQFQGYCTDVFFAEALAFIREHRHEPFFVYLPTNIPHSPYNVADRYAATYREKGVPPTMARFYGMIENLDENMGTLMETLRELGLEENTLLIYMTDNGTAEGASPPRDPSPKGAWPGFNAGMRGKKGSAYDGGHRVPCFLRWPAGGIGGGRDIDNLTAHIDLLPTILDLCGVDPLPSPPLDGRSLRPLLQGDTAPWPDRTLVVHSQRIEYPKVWRESAVMSGPWRLIDGKELYDIKNDPAQSNNLAASQPQILTTLRRAYEDWWESLRPSFDEFAWLVLGDEQANPATLTCHDWHAPENQVPWHQGAVRAMPQANGVWMVEIAQPGEYAFTLRHQPTEARFPLRAQRARLKIGPYEASRDVPDEATAVTLTLSLKPGRFPLQTWLEREDPAESRGAFFTEVMRMSEPPNP